MQFHPFPGIGVFKCSAAQPCSANCCLVMIMKYLLHMKECLTLNMTVLLVSCLISFYGITNNIMPAQIQLSKYNIYIWLSFDSCNSVTQQRSAKVCAVHE